ncbi:hypothetical protein ACI7RC_08440 [Brevibacillus sp. B_LB10_24]|uniref:hypothetical protein n=1 Tax=Brevibacillus sp. B_LB10_24 TaxID=3380645 RepID=UPI0038BC68A1
MIKQLYFGIIFNSAIIIVSCIHVVIAPYLFVKIINLIVIIALSMGAGAFIRELFVQKEKAKAQSMRNKPPLA